MNDIVDRMDDHALERVPDRERAGWLKLSWNTAGIVTTLIQLFFGALVTFVAGMRVAIWSGLIVTLIGASLGWAVGHVGCRTGLSSTLITRGHGLGKRGSLIASLIFGFMIIGFLAIENALLYNGLLFFLNLPDTLLWKLSHLRQSDRGLDPLDGIRLSTGRAGVLHRPRSFFRRFGMDASQNRPAILTRDRNIVLLWRAIAGGRTRRDGNSFLGRCPDLLHQRAHRFGRCASAGGWRLWPLCEAVARHRSCGLGRQHRNVHLYAGLLAGSSCTQASIRW